MAYGERRFSGGGYGGGGYGGGGGRRFGGGGDRGGFDRDFGSVPVKVGEELDVTIEAVGEKGDGIAKKDGFVLFVPNTKEGERIKVRVTKVLRKVGFAEKIGEAGAPSAPSEQKSESTEAEHSEEEQQPEASEEFGEEEESEPMEQIE